MVLSMAGTWIRLMAVILCFSYLILICMSGAIPSTRSSNLVQKPQIHEAAKRVLLENRDFLMRRMQIEVNDYPGSGANNRHTPRPLLGRGCSDC